MAPFQVIVGIPVFNEEASLLRLLRRFAELHKSFDSGRFQVVIVDDGSTDRTAVIARDFARTSTFITVIRHDANQGLGAAIMTLFRFVAEQGEDADVFVTLDGDNTHNPALIPAMVRKLKGERLDLVIASRFARGGKEIGVSFFRKLCSRGAKAFFKIFFPIPHVNDYSCGFRCYSVGYLKKALRAFEGRLVTSTGFASMAEVLAKFRIIGINAREYPLVLEYHRKRSVSKMKIIRTTKGYFKLLQTVRQAEAQMKGKGEAP